MQDVTQSPNNEAYSFSPLPNVDGPFLGDFDAATPSEAVMEFYKQLAVGSVFTSRHASIDGNYRTRGYGITLLENVDADGEWRHKLNSREHNLAYISKWELEELEAFPTEYGPSGVYSKAQQDWDERAMRTFGLIAAERLYEVEVEHLNEPEPLQMGLDARLIFPPETEPPKRVVGSVFATTPTPSLGNWGYDLVIETDGDVLAQVVLVSQDGFETREKAKAAATWACSEYEDQHPEADVRYPDAD